MLINFDKIQKTAQLLSVFTKRGGEERPTMTWLLSELHNFLSAPSSYLASESWGRRCGWLRANLYQLVGWVGGQRG